MAGSRIRLPALIGVAALALAIGACTHAPPHPPPGPPASPPSARGLEGTSWILAADSLEVPIPAGRSVTAQFQDGEMSGIAACNRYRAPYQAGPGNRLVLGEVVTTRIACEEPILRAEQAFTARLRRVTTFHLDRNGLRLGDGRTDLLRFTRTFVPTPPDPPATTPAGSWRVTRYVDAADRLVEPLPGTTITLQLAPGGRLGGRVCNEYFGAWSSSGDAVEIRDTGSTLMLCAEPEGIMQQEEDFLTALRGAVTWRVEGDTLTLSHPRTTVVVAQRAR